MSAGADKSVLRTKVLAALEQAARGNATRFRMGDGWMKSDEQAVRYGPLTPTISSHIDGHITSAQLRSVLSAEVNAGRVMRQQDRQGGMIRYWPVGLWDKLQAERAAVTQCWRCQGEGIVHTGIDEAPTTICKTCNGTGERAAQEGGAV